MAVLRQLGSFFRLSVDVSSWRPGLSWSSAPTAVVRLLRQPTTAGPVGIQLLQRVSDTEWTERRSHYIRISLDVSGQLRALTVTSALTSLLRVALLVTAAQLLVDFLLFYAMPNAALRRKLRTMSITDELGTALRTINQTRRKLRSQKRKLRRSAYTSGSKTKKGGGGGGGGDDDSGSDDDARGGSGAGKADAFAKSVQRLDDRFAVEMASAGRSAKSRTGRMGGMFDDRAAAIPGFTSLDSESGSMTSSVTSADVEELDSRLRRLEMALRRADAAARPAAKPTARRAPRTGIAAATAAASAVSGSSSSLRSPRPPSSLPPPKGKKKKKAVRRGDLSLLPT
eukprot:PLAT4561.1.p1 GENE.PLAT4561.1~~PLAT4561.1.p1  ORF type:complete len:341 (+),score=169.56 PLAT4561.1:673-1695(+)